MFLSIWFLLGGCHTTLGLCISATFFFFYPYGKGMEKLRSKTSRASAFLLVMYASLRIAIAIDIHIYTYVLIYICIWTVYVYITYTYIHIFCNYICIYIYTRNYACVFFSNRFKCRIRHFYKQLFTSHVQQHPTSKILKSELHMLRMGLEDVLPGLGSWGSWFPQPGCARPHM